MFSTLIKNTTKSIHAQTEHHEGEAIDSFSANSSVGAIELIKIAILKEGNHHFSYLIVCGGRRLNAAIITLLKLIAI